MEQLQNRGEGEHINESQKIQSDFQLKLEEEYLKWKQKAKQHSLKQENKNTRFFHVHANRRRKTNNISQIMSLDGVILTKQQHMGNLFSSLYSQLFTSSNPLLIEAFLQGLSPRR